MQPISEDGKEHSLPSQSTSNRRKNVKNDSSTRECMGAACSGRVGRDNYCAKHRPPTSRRARSPIMRSPVGASPATRKRPIGAGDKESVATSVSNRLRSMSSVNSTEGNTIDKFLDAIRHIASEREAHKAALKIIEETCLLLNADRATMFFVDDSTNELVLLIAKGADGIRIPMGSGIAGYVAQTGETVNVPDAYKEPRFNPSFDKKTGYRTKSIIACPVRDFEGEIVAVLQAINKLDGGDAFSAIDETLLENLASHVGVTLRNAQYYEQAASTKKQVTSLLHVVKLLHSEPNAQSLLHALNQHATALVQAERCTVYVVDRARQQLMLMRGDLSVDIRFPLTKGIAGHVAKTGKALNILDAYEDKRFNKDDRYGIKLDTTQIREYDHKSGFETRTILCMPIFNPEREVIGVLQVLNKLNDEKFLEEDEQILETLLDIAGSILAKDVLFQTKTRQTEVELAADLVARQHKPRKSLTGPILESLQETIDEEDEEELSSEGEGLQGGVETDDNA